MFDNKQFVIITYTFNMSSVEFRKELKGAIEANGKIVGNSRLIMKLRDKDYIVASTKMSHSDINKCEKILFR